jgi:hypothetical protein
MGVNRFMTPAELPKVSFFQLPYEQMKEGIMSAQMQQDAAREGISQIGDISFNYLTNSKIDPEIAKGVYGELDSKTQAVLSKQGNGDLRGLRGEIYNLGKEVGRWYKPDGKIGRLQSNYLQFMDWYKRQTENKDLDPKYVQDAAKAIIDDYDAKGGAQAGGIYTEDLKKHFDYSKFVNDNKDMIKSTIIQRERDILGNNGYKYTDEELQKFITPEKIMYTMSEILESNPEHLSSLQQRIRFGNLPKESQSTLIQSGKDDKGQPIYGLNPYSPAAGAIQGAMRGLGGMEEDRQRHSIGTDEPWMAFWRNKVDKETMEPLIESNFGEVVKNKQDQVNTIQRNYTGTPEQTALLQAATKEYGEVVAKHVLDEKGQVKPAFKEYFKDTPDLNGKTIPKEDILQGYIMSLHDPKYNGGHGIWSRDEVMVKYLETKGFKVNATLNDGLFKKLKSMYSGLYGNSTDIPNVNSLMRDDINGIPVPADNSAIGALYSDLRKTQKVLVGKPVDAQQSPMKIVPPKSKNPVFATYQDLNSLKTQANSYNYLNSATGEGGSLSQLLAKKAYDKTVNIGFATQDPNATNPNEPQRTFLILQPVDDKGKPKGAPEKIEIFSKTSGTQNQLAAAASHSLQTNKSFYGNFTTGNNAGMNARVNVFNASQEELDNQDYYNENGK